MITPYRPDIVPNARYSVKQTAELLGVHPNTILNYTKRRVLRVSYSKADGRPKYTGAEILRFWEETV